MTDDALAEDVGAVDEAADSVVESLFTKVAFPSMKTLEYAKGAW